MKPRLLAAALLFLTAAFGGDEDVTKTIKDLYASTLSAMKTAKTKDDIQTIVNGMDVPAITITTAKPLSLASAATVVNDRVLPLWM